MTEAEAQAAYDEAPLSWVESTNTNYGRIQKVFEVRQQRRQQCAAALTAHVDANPGNCVPIKLTH